MFFVAKPHQLCIKISLHPYSCVLRGARQAEEVVAPLHIVRELWYNLPRSSGKAGVAQWQSSSLPSWLRGFDSLRPLQGRSSQGGVMAAAADSKSAVREYVRVRVPPLAPALRSCGWQAGQTGGKPWRGVRVVDGATLERLCGRKSTGGSNPPPSANKKSRG